MPNFKTSKANDPSTPVMKRFFRGVFRPTLALGKRGRNDEENEPPSPSPAPKSRQSCIALQNEDIDEDAVVITALSEVPFCCHADLLVMTRDELITTANALNTKLPHALQVDTLRSDVYIRNSIEVLVGIRTDVPPPPMLNRTLSVNTSAFDATFERSSMSMFQLPSPRSPLALRDQSRVSRRESLASPGGLTSLREETEDSLSSDRPTKRRRTDGPSPGSLATTPTPAARVLGRSQSHRVAHSRVRSPNPEGSRGLSRSQSHRLPERRFIGLHRNITVGRGRRASGYAREQNAVMTSTPPRRPRKSVPRGDGANGFDKRDSSPTSTRSGISTTSVSSEERTQRVIAWLDEAGEEGTKSVMAGMKNLGLETSDSEMDIDM